MTLRIDQTRSPAITSGRRGIGMRGLRAPDMRNVKIPTGRAIRNRVFKDGRGFAFHPVRTTRPDKNMVAMAIRRTAATKMRRILMLPWTRLLRGSIPRALRIGDVAR